MHKRYDKMLNVQKYCEWLQDAYTPIKNTSRTVSQSTRWSWIHNGEEEFLLHSYQHFKIHTFRMYFLKIAIYSSVFLVGK